jgi:hypothetical protein
MPNPELPPFGDETNENEAVNDTERTRENPAYRGDTERMARHRTKQMPQAVQPPQQQASIQPPPQGYRPRPPRRSEKDSGLYLPWWSIVLMLFAVLIISFGIVGGIYLLGASSALLSNPTPIIRIITAIPPDAQQGIQPTAQAPSTQIISGQNPPENLQLQGPTLVPIQFTPTPAAIRIGSRIIVEGVDLQTLNVRDSTAINEQNIVFRAVEGEIFTVVEGPSQASGFTWWRIQDPDNPTRVGWAVSNYLKVIPN